MLRVRRFFVTFLVALLVASPASAVEPGPSGPLVPGLRPSNEITGPVLATGRLLDVTGAPVAGRAVAVAWPTMASLAALDDGDPVKTLPIAQVFAGRDGRFSLRVDPRIDLAEYTEADGTINLDLRAEGDAGIGLFGFSRRLVGGGQPAWLDPGQPSPESAELAVTLDGPSSRTALPADTSTGEDKTGTCPDYIVATYDQRPVDIAESYAGPYNRAKFIYVQSASSTLGIGVSTTGAFGSFTVSGSLTGSSGAGLDFAERGANNRTTYQTTWQYRKIDIWQGYYTCSHWRYEVRAVAWQGGMLSWTPGSTPTATNCSPIEAGGTPYKYQGTAATFSAGAKLSGQIGNNLSAQTGFTTKVSFRFPFTAAGRLCGSNTTWMTAARVVGKGP